MSKRPAANRKASNKVADFERAIEDAANGDAHHYVLRLYVTGSTPRSSIQGMRSYSGPRLDTMR